MIQGGQGPRCCPQIAELIPPGLFKALSDPNRIAIVARLAESCCPRTVSELSTCCPVDVSVVSRHLAILRDAGVVQARKRGREVFYAVRIPSLVAALRALADGLQACCPDDPPEEDKDHER